MNPDSASPDFNDGLLPVIVQDFQSNKVLMLAWMNLEAWEATLTGKSAVYWSRKRKALWRKGEVSGNVQVVKSVYIDCDHDSILLKVEQKGMAACHTGHESCFFQEIQDDKIIVDSSPLFNPSEVYGIKEG